MRDGAVIIGARKRRVLLGVLLVGNLHIRLNIARVDGDELVAIRSLMDVTQTQHKRKTVTYQNTISHKMTKTIISI